MDQAVIVQKYGGSSVANPEKIKAVAGFIKQCLEREQRICVVVSAMGHTTNGLISLAEQICADPPKREIDMLISCGERTSMALLAMALNDIGIRAISLTGSQSGIITDDNHSGAEIIAIRPSRVQEAFFQYQVVIIAGFQGVSLGKEITTLRRGGSDTTAVAMAAALNAKVCEIYTDVPGVMDIDPKIVPYAQVLPAVSIEQMESMSLYGAKVLAHDAIRLAKEHNVILRVSQAEDAFLGTTINQVDLKPKSNGLLTAITHLRGLISLKLKSLDGIANEAGYFLCGHRIGDGFVVYVSNDISQELTGHEEAQAKAGLALIALHLAKNQAASRVVSSLEKLFAREKIALLDLVIGRDEVFVIVSDDELLRSLNILYENLLGGSSKQ